MESIKQALRQFQGPNRGTEHLDALAAQVRQHPTIQSFLNEHPGMEELLVSRYLPKAYEVIEAERHCVNCPGLEGCPNVLQGYTPELTSDKGSVTVTYSPCQLKRNEEHHKRKSALIKSFYVPKDVLKATFRTIDIKDRGRQDALEAAGRFVQNYLNNPKETKGLYFYGQFGVGKTHVMGAIMNELAERAEIESLMVYTPDFFRELKNSIQDQTVEEKVSYIQSVPLLILDDIGAETMSPWIRDEVLGSVLQRRMMDQLPTLFTSNYDLDELEEHLAYSNKSGTELLKARRLMERIRHFTHAVSLSGANRRLH